MFAAHNHVCVWPAFYCIIWLLYILVGQMDEWNGLVGWLAGWMDDGMEWMDRWMDAMCNEWNAMEWMLAWLVGLPGWMDDWEQGERKRWRQQTRKNLVSNDDDELRLYVDYMIISLSRMTIHTHTHPHCSPTANHLYHYHNGWMRLVFRWHTKTHIEMRLLSSIHFLLHFNDDFLVKPNQNGSLMVKLCLVTK